MKKNVIKSPFYPSTIMADPSEPHESTTFAESYSFESAYTARVNELESFLHSVEESEEHDSKQTEVAPSGNVNIIVRMPEGSFCP